MNINNMTVEELITRLRQEDQTQFTNVCEVKSLAGEYLLEIVCEDVEEKDKELDERLKKICDLKDVCDNLRAVLRKVLNDEHASGMIKAETVADACEALQEN